MFVVYLTYYKGNLLPPYYIGSTSKQKIDTGEYFGSISSKKWKTIFNNEIKNNKHLFSVKILSYHLTRKEALEEELKIQISKNVVKSSKYFNESLARINGMFGRDVKGKNNPMYGKSRPDSRELMLGDNNIAKREYVKKKLRNAKKDFKPWNVGKNHSEEIKKKMRESRLGKEPSNKGQSKYTIYKEKYKEIIIQFISNNYYATLNDISDLCKIDKKLSNSILDQLRNDNIVTKKKYSNKWTLY